MFRWVSRLRGKCKMCSAHKKTIETLETTVAAQKKMLDINNELAGNISKEYLIRVYITGLMRYLVEPGVFLITSHTRDDYANTLKHYWEMLVPALEYLPDTNSSNEALQQEPPPTRQVQATG